MNGRIWEKNQAGDAALAYSRDIVRRNRTHLNNDNEEVV